KPDQDEPLIEWPSRSKILKDALLSFSPSHRFDVQSLEDIRPGVIDAVETGRWFAERVGSIARTKSVALQQRLAKSAGLARRRVERAHEILFVCYGNIN